MTFESGKKMTQLTNSYVALDLETTGLNPRRDKIIEIGAVRIRDGRPTETMSVLVNPGRRLGERIIELTGIRDEQLSQARDASVRIPELLGFIGEDALLGHSVLFDYSFVRQAAANLGLSFERSGIDTLRLARKFLPELESRSLEYLCGYFQIRHHAHRALDDALAAEELYRRLADRFASEETSELFAPRTLVYHAKREQPASKRQKELLYKLIDQHKITVDYDIDKLTRSEANRFTDQILAAYGR